MKNKKTNKITENKYEMTKFNKSVYIIGFSSAIALIFINILWITNGDTKTILLSLSGSLIASLVVSFLLELSSNFNKTKIINTYRGNDLMPLTLNIKLLLNNYINYFFELLNQFNLYNGEPVTFKFGDSFKDLEKVFNYVDKIYNNNVKDEKLTYDEYLKVKNFKEFVFTKFNNITKNIDEIILNEQNRYFNFSLNEIEQLKIIKYSYNDYMGLEEFEITFLMLKQFYTELIKLSIFTQFENCYIIKKGARQNFYDKSDNLLITKSKLDVTDTKQILEVVKANYEINYKKI